jgi:hypothetical protein
LFTTENLKEWSMNWYNYMDKKEKNWNRGIFGEKLGWKIEKLFDQILALF